MKKKILGGIAVLAIATVAAWNVNFNSQKNDLSDIALANLEALAQEYWGPEVVISCGRTRGQCWVWSPYMSGEYWYNSCKWSGHTSDYCPF